MATDTPATQVDLARFCARESSGRYALTAPFSRGDYTYATDGAIMARVPRRADVPELPDAPHAERIWPIEEWPSRFARLASADLPAPDRVECPGCEGRGREHECPGCQCVCPSCNGSGTVLEDARFEIGNAQFDIRYVRILIDLPGLEIEADPQPHGPMCFRFQGGEGLLMPMRNREDWVTRLALVEGDGA